MWSLAVARHTRPEALQGEPLLIVDDRVSGATEEVLEAGVVLGMPRREAEALAPFAAVINRDLGDETRRFEPVVAVVENLVPRVEVVAPGLIFVPVAGAVRFYGGEEALADRIDEELNGYFASRNAVDASEASAGGSELSERRGPLVQSSSGREFPEETPTCPNRAGVVPPHHEPTVGLSERRVNAVDASEASAGGSELSERRGPLEQSSSGREFPEETPTCPNRAGVVPPHCLGIADGPFAARWAAATAVVGEPNIVTDTIGFLSRLDLGALREEMGGEEMIDTFRWLGIATLGDLARLPRETLASRFGNPGLMAHRLATGEDRPVDPRDIPLELGVEMSFEEPLQSLDAVAFAGRNLAEKLLGRLRSAGVAPHTVTITAGAASGPSRTRVWRSADPFTEQALTDRVWWQLRAWVETVGVPGGITRLEITPENLSGEGRQLGLLTDESSIVEAERALARAQALLGPDGVLQARAQGGRMPTERVAWSRWGEPEAPEDRDVTAPWPGATPGPAPALVPLSLHQIEVEWDGGMPSRVRLGSRWEPVLTWSGPWRLAGRWWVGEGDLDRYQLVTSVGAFLCVVSGDRAYLAGVYD